MKTNKKRIANYLKLGILLLGISALLWNCEKDEIITVPEKEKSLFVQNRINISKVPEIKQLLPTQLRSKYKSKTHKLNEAIFDEENILEVIDTLNFKNYSFRFTLPNSKIGEFYNLVIGKDSEGNLVTPFVLKYVCDDDFLDEFISNKFSLRYFIGEISKHRYTDYFEKEYFDKTSTNCPPTLDANGDPVPCETIKADGSVSGGGITSTPNVGSSGIGTTSTNCISFTVEVLCSCEGHFVGEQCTCGQNGNSGQAAYYDVWTYCITQEQKSASKTDCPPCSINSDGLVGINTIDIGSLRTKLINNIRGINNEQINWINKDDNIENFLSIITLLNQNADLNGNWTSEALNHSKQIINAGIENALLSISPFVKYPPNSNYETLYPKLTEYLKNQIPKVGDIPVIVNAIKKYTNLSVEEIKRQLKWGNGPTIKIEQLGNHSIIGEPFYAEFRKDTDPNSIYLDIDLVNQLENSSPGSSLAEAFTFWIGVCILHEFVHYGDYNYNSNTWVYPQEEGLLFERDVYGHSVWIEDGKIVIR